MFSVSFALFNAKQNAENTFCYFKIYVVFDRSEETIWNGSNISLRNARRFCLQPLIACYLDATKYHACKKGGWFKKKDKQQKDTKAGISENINEGEKGELVVLQQEEQ